MSAFRHLFDMDGEYMPHGHCYLWYPEILWLHIISDALIAASYFSIPVALFFFARIRKDMPFRPVLGLFAAFILLCGLTHLFGIWTIWNPDYGPQGLLKALTAIVSLLTAIYVWRFLPSALRLPSPANLQQANEELIETNQRIERQVTERTAALEITKTQLVHSEGELRIAYEEARRANQAKSEFLAHMSHEIRTPLSSVTTIAELLPRTGDLNAKQQELVDTLRVGARSLLDLINDILDISKIEAGEFELYERPFEWDALIDDTARVISVRAEEKGIQLRSNAGALTGKWLMGDSARLRQVLLNLLGNAVKFTEQGEVVLNVLVEGESLIIIVSDTGVGIPEHQLDTVFEKFRQAENTHLGGSGGTGLGLAITHHLISLMGGDISLLSTVGKGSTFTIRLPLRIVDDQEETPSPAASSHYSANEKSGEEARKILLVEDYPGNILVATTLLSELGYAYDIAKNGKEALAMQAQDGCYFAVLMDVNMPEMNGLDATREWRKREQESGAPRTPIIGLTAHALAGDDVQCLDAGMDSYMAKPLTLESLQASLDKLDNSGHS